MLVILPAMTWLVDKFFSTSIHQKNTMCPIKERGIVSEMMIILFCPFQIKEYEKLDSEEERLTRSRQIYDVYIMKELLSCSHVRIKFGRLDYVSATSVLLILKRVSYSIQFRSAPVMSKLSICYMIICKIK